MAAKLILFPVPIGEGPASLSIPAYNREMLNSCRIFIVEDIRTARRNLRAMGYEQVELIDTTKGMFISPSEARWMALTGSALLVGKK